MPANGQSSSGTERVECSVCGGDGYEPVHAGVIECGACDGTGSVQTEADRHE